MFLLLTDYHSTKKVLVNLDDVRRVDVFQEAFARLTFKDKEVFDTSESFEDVSGYVMEWQPMTAFGISNEKIPLESNMYSLPCSFPPDFNAPPEKPFFPDEIPPDINDIPKRD